MGAPSLLALALVIGLQLMAGVLPRIVVPVAVVAGVFVVVRLVMFFTQRW